MITINHNNCSDLFCIFIDCVQWRGVCCIYSLLISSHLNHRQCCCASECYFAAAVQCQRAMMSRHLQPLQSSSSSSSFFETLRIRSRRRPTTATTSSCSHLHGSSTAINSSSSHSAIFDLSCEKQHYFSTASWQCRDLSVCVCAVCCVCCFFFYSFFSLTESCAESVRIPKRVVFFPSFALPLPLQIAL